MNRIKSFIFLMIMASNSAYAKWAKFEEAAISTELVQKIQIKKNGSSEELIEVQWEILKESARNFASNFHLNYNGDSSKIKILEAKTIYKGKVYSVDPNFLEDKPLASAPQGFDQIRQVMIAFPNIEIGAKIYVKYKYTFSKVPLDNYYSGRLEFGRREWLKKSHVTLTSEIPLSILVNDPSDSLEIKKDKSDGLHRLEVVLKKPIYKDTINEPELGLIDERLFTWISLSSINNWRELAIKFALQNYAQVFTQPLPPYFGEILKKATEKKNDIDQINTITSSLDEKIRYMGDWRTVEGRFTPHSLAEIAHQDVVRIHPPPMTARVDARV